MATKKSNTAKKGKKATKPLHGAKRLEPTKPLAVDTFLKIDGLKHE
jgi:hypothetical protein